jgi:HTH-type transcriptional regulator / antitoxin HigA
MPETAFQPNWFSKPGDTLSTIMNKREMTPDTLASCMGRDASVVHGLLSGNVAIDKPIAGLLAKCVGGSPAFWVTRQSQFEGDLDRAVAAVSTDQGRSWLRHLPIKEMTESGWIPASKEARDTLKAALTYFDVTDPEEWRERYRAFENSFSFRTSPTFESKLGALAAWLRQAEIQASRMPCATWNPAGLRARLNALRVLTKATNLAHFIPRLRELCAEVGVVLVFLKAPPGCRASGATRFLSSTKAMIVLSFRYLSDDQFWFSFFHEIGHLLLHGTEATFVDGDAADPTDREVEANAFSEGVLIPHDRRDELMALPCHARDVIRFAVSVGVSPGIVVGQMQHRRIIGPHQLNGLKRRYEWDEIRGAVG